MAWFIFYLILTLLQNNNPAVQVLRTSCVQFSCIGALLCLQLGLEMDPFFLTLSEIQPKCAYTNT